MTVRELIEQLEGFDNDMEVVIGMKQNYGSNFAMEIVDCIDEYNVATFEDESVRTVVITEGNQIGIVDYEEDE